MKKLFILIVSLFLSFSLFAENDINLKGIALASFSKHTTNSRTYSTTRLNGHLSAEYLYNFDFGLSVGAEVSGIGSMFFNTYNGEIYAITTADGVGFDIAPAIGFSTGDKTFVQLIAYPLIIENINYSNIEATVGSLTAKVKGDIDFTTVKTGAMASLEWGWKHFKLGFGGGFNVILADNYNTDKDLKPNMGFEIFVCDKISFLF